MSAKGHVASAAERRGELLEPDPVIEAYKKDVDVTLLERNLRLTVEERILNLQSFVEFALELRKAVKTARP